MQISKVSEDQLDIEQEANKKSFCSDSRVTVDSNTGKTSRANWSTHPFSELGKHWTGENVSIFCLRGNMFTWKWLGNGSPSLYGAGCPGSQNKSPWSSGSADAWRGNWRPRAVFGAGFGSSDQSNLEGFAKFGFKICNLGW